MKKAWLSVAVLLAVAGVAQAQQSDTLKKIKDSGTVTMGVRESSGALAYTLGDGKYAGFHYDVCQKVLADVQKQLGLAKLDIKYQPVTSQNRIPLVRTAPSTSSAARPPTTPPARRTSPSPSPPTWKKCASR
jgi:glutamate/aspartate transport system substrate-binding protein